jgi:hypothetical protein
MPWHESYVIETRDCHRLIELQDKLTAKASFKTTANYLDDELAGQTCIFRVKAELDAAPQDTDQIQSELLEAADARQVFYHQS